MLTKLTATQESQLAEFRQKWLAIAKRIAQELVDQFETTMTWVPIDGPAMAVIDALAELPFCAVSIGMPGNAPLEPGEQN